MSPDQLTKKYTAFETLEEMLAKQADGYRPSIYTRGSKAKRQLADAYDAEAARQGLPMRAFRGL